MKLIGIVFGSLVFLCGPRKGESVIFLTLLLNSFMYMYKPIESQVGFFCAQSIDDGSMMEQVFMLDNALSEKLNTSKPIAFFIHGYLESYTHGVYTDISRDYIEYFEGNFCMVNWENLAAMLYAVSAEQTERVGNYTADFIQYLLDYEYFAIDQINLFGFSLGAHAAGSAGARLGGQVPLIVGIDPAGLGFTRSPMVRNGNQKLKRSDAKYVQVIHSDKMILGTDVALGDADYFPNGASNPQPGCAIIGLPDLIACSHMRSRDIFRASLNPNTTFVGYQCSSYDDYLRGSCSSNSIDLFGLYSSNSVNGTLYFETSAVYPYAIN